MEAWVTTAGSVFDGLWLRMGVRSRERSSMKNKKSLVMELRSEDDGENLEIALVENEKTLKKQGCHRRHGGSY